MALLSCPIFLAHAKPPTGSGKPQATNFAKETDFLEKAFDPLFLSILKYCEFLGAHWCLMFLNILMDYSENSPFQRIVNLLPHLFTTNFLWSVSQFTWCCCSHLWDELQYKGYWIATNRNLQLNGNFFVWPSPLTSSASQFWWWAGCNLSHFYQIYPPPIFFSSHFFPSIFLIPFFSTSNFYSKSASSLALKTTIHSFHSSILHLHLLLSNEDNHEVEFSPEMIDVIPRSPIAHPAHLPLWHTVRPDQSSPITWKGSASNGALWQKLHIQLFFVYSTN